VLDFVNGVWDAVVTFPHAGPSRGKPREVIFTMDFDSADYRCLSNGMKKANQSSVLSPDAAGGSFRP
jgi:hypothetical protein